ncbi:MAG: hypothetical protein J5629_07035 [Muribaculaceae bacterium]|nr:hypothetical protein [Muribaculaceae bacterium]
MNTTEFYQIKQDVLSRPICYRELEAKEIIALGENHYTVGNATFKVDSRVASRIDSFAGIKRGQSAIAHDSYGEQGLTNLRNFFGQAAPRKSKRIVLAADKQSKQIVEAIPISNRMITPEVFFDFAEMFMDKNRYLPYKVEYSMGGNGNRNGNGNISILMKPVTEQFMEFAPGDEFLANGLYLAWNPGEIGMGNYYVRQVCSNGQTQITHHSITKAFSPEAAKLKALLDITAESEPLKKNLDRMLLSARLAMRTSASVHELKAAMKMLNGHGLTEQDANQIIPYEQTRSKYETAGFLLSSTEEAQAKSDRTMWEVFNLLTFFATHNTVWARQDIRRSSLMEASMNLLLRERDIKEYYNIF